MFPPNRSLHRLFPHLPPKEAHTFHRNIHGSDSPYHHFHRSHPSPSACRRSLSGKSVYFPDRLSQSYKPSLRMLPDFLSASDMCRSRSSVLPHPANVTPNQNSMEKSFCLRPAGGSRQQRHCLSQDILPSSVHHTLQSLRSLLLLRFPLCRNQYILLKTGISVLQEVFHSPSLPDPFYSQKGTPVFRILLKVSTKSPYVPAHRLPR